ncbi:MAG: DUF721 domain-containing protein [Muribaculaceae bacterium]|nr:DUF721 domain-containing protein [Muribaculaceae bacterium]
MNRLPPQSVGDVLRNLLEETSLQARMDELRAAGLWDKIVGRQIASQTGKPQVKNGLMYVPVANPVLRNELYMTRSRIREIINTNFGKEIIKEIKFTS